MDGNIRKKTRGFLSIMALIELLLKVGWVGLTSAWDPVDNENSSDD